MNVTRGPGGVGPRLSASVNSHGVPRGLRGIANLGNTCFMSTVLQAVIRAPTLSGYFLREGHNRDVCAVERAHRVAAALHAGASAAREDEYCLAGAVQ